MSSIAAQAEDITANPKTLKVSGIKTKELSELSPGMVNLRQEDAAGQVTTYQINPQDLSIFQRIRTQSNDYFIENDTLRTGFISVAGDKLKSLAAKTTELNWTDAAAAFTPWGVSQIAAKQIIRRVF